MTEQLNLEDVFVTEGLPEKTFVEPPNFNALLVDIRRKAKPVIVEGQTGTGKTTTVKKIISRLFPDETPRVLTPREPADVPVIENISENSGDRIFIIDDFHRLETNVKEKIANLAKMIAERDDRTNLPKIVIIGINEVGSDLIQLVPDIAKRIGIHRISSGSADEIKKIVSLGSQALNIEIQNVDAIFAESSGDYWLTQQLCKAICLNQGISETMETVKTVPWDVDAIRNSIVETLNHSYDPAIREFCRGRRFRPSNDPYFKLLNAISKQDHSNVDLNELANSLPDIKGSINNIKDRRLVILLEQKELCSKHFYYNSTTKNFAIEDPALFYYLKNLDWEQLRQRCGFRQNTKDFEFDIAISFAGENRELANFIAEQLNELDISCFYDRNYEDNYLGALWSDRFNEVFVEKSRVVVVILDKFHKEKVWPTFERECFQPRVKMGEVIPIVLDYTTFVGFPADLVAIHYKFDGDLENHHDEIIDKIVLRIAGNLDNY